MRQFAPFQFIWYNHLEVEECRNKGEMLMEITLVISIIGVVISVSAFIMSRKDKAVSHEAEEQKQFSQHDLIQYRLEKIEQNIEKILAKLDTYEKEIDDKIEKAMKNHIATHHK